MKKRTNSERDEDSSLQDGRRDGIEASTTNPRLRRFLLSEKLAIVSSGEASEKGMLLLTARGEEFMNVLADMVLKNKSAPGSD